MRIEPNMTNAAHGAAKRGRLLALLAAGTAIVALPKSGPRALRRATPPSRPSS
ncbi:MAG: hypothetical protein WDM81_06215 [Rhizomicrobium sp.]